MGNNLGKRGNNSKSFKIMKINGDYFKLKTPSKVIDIIKNYPNHILLDSQDFLLFNLRAKPLDLDFELKPKRIYLLFELPQFPQNNPNNNNNINNISTYLNSIGQSPTQSPLRRVRSSVVDNPTTRRMLMTKRSISDLTIMTKSTAQDGPSVGPTRVKVKLPKAEVERIMEESNDDVEVARRILRLLTTVGGGGAVVDAVGGGGHGGGEEVEFEILDDRHCFNIHGMCGSQQNKYMKIT